MVTQSYKSLFEATRIILKRASDQGLIYVELRFSPQLQTLKGLCQEEAVQAVMEAQKEAPIESGLILCFMRHSGFNEKNQETLKIAKKYYQKGVDGVDLCGAEALYPTSSFEDLFKEVQNEGIISTIHAGEADGPSSVEAALRFKAQRLGHGIRAVYQKSTIDKVIKEQIPLELCLTSEIQTKCMPSFKEYPLRKLMEEGAFITINTDDQAISGISLNSEYRLLKKEFNVTKEETSIFIQNGINAAFCSEEKKEKLFFFQC